MSQDTVRPEVALTATLTALWAPWLNVSSALLANGTLWAYVGTESGVFRIMPGNAAPRRCAARVRGVRAALTLRGGGSYDPREQPWYNRALADKSRSAISTPYTDTGGTGVVRGAGARGHRVYCERLTGYTADRVAESGRVLWRI
jgi:hypothetical protein